MGRRNPDYSKSSVPSNSVPYNPVVDIWKGIKPLGTGICGHCRENKIGLTFVCENCHHRVCSRCLRNHVACHSDSKKTLEKFLAKIEEEKKKNQQDSSQSSSS
ncbi:MAG TPA: hypothetical protein VLI92_01545 [Candidatus Saccharimonadales bacterium]|nr:hypothetical protein [Candidatus Saccharimonadales bacterium]